MIGFYKSLSQLCRNWLAPVVNVLGRYYVAMDFFSSGLLKLEDFEETRENFGPDGDFVLPLINGDVAAVLATAGELVLPVMLILGLFTRIGAIGLFIMALVIELFVFPGTAVHYYWMIAFGLLAAYGGDKLSLDNFLLKIKG